MPIKIQSAEKGHPNSNKLQNQTRLHNQLDGLLGVTGKGVSHSVGSGAFKARNVPKEGVALLIKSPAKLQELTCSLRNALVVKVLVDCAFAQLSARSGS